MKPSLLFLALSLAIPLRGEEPDYFPAVAKLIEDRCLDCHSADDPDGKLVMEKHADIMKGGESGEVVTAGKGAESLLVRYLRGEVVKGGKKKFMPPGKRDKLTATEVEVFVKWIDAGAKPPQREMTRKVVEVPKVAPKGVPRESVNALAFSPQAKLVAVGRGGVIELLDPVSQAVVKRLEVTDGKGGPVNALVWSADGARLFAGSGESAVAGEVREWDVARATVVRTFTGHRDMIYALALSPDGKTLATGSYDQKIKLWNVADGAERKTLSGHNGAVFALAFRPDGKLLASASADRTVKLWDATSGERRDTLGQPTKEQFAVAWSADGERLAAAGADNRIRVWRVSPDAKETTNPLEVVRFAHEQAILRLVWSADGATMLSSAQDGTVRVWDAGEVKERVSLEKQPDWPTALTFSGREVVTGRADGTVAFYDSMTGKPVAAPKSGHLRSARKIFCQKKGKGMGKATPPPKGPFVSALLPRAVQRGHMAEMRLSGGNLPQIVTVKCEDARVRVFAAMPDPGKSAARQLRGRRERRGRKGIRARDLANRGHPGPRVSRRGENGKADGAARECVGHPGEGGRERPV
jgi:WD40 repeat protein